MNRRSTKNILWTLLLAGLACPAWAHHGPLASAQRDAWINAELSTLVASGLSPDPGKPVEKLTNFEVAQLTAEAFQRVAQADELPPALDSEPPALPGAPPPATDSTGLPQAGASLAAKSLGDLVEEFKGELSTLGLDVDKLEDRIASGQTREDVFAVLQQEYLKRTGTEVGGLSKGYMYNYRGFGTNAAYPPMDYNAAIFMQMDLKSVPVPNILFDARLRFWRSIGMYYQDPIQPEYQLRWISLSDINDYADLTAGDFYKSYTPLTLWDSDEPVYTFIEPTSFHRTRMDTEELVYMDHAPDWHMRGFQALSRREWPKDLFSGYSLQAMGGTMFDATGFTFGSYYAGSQGSLSLLSNNVEIKGTGLLLWQDPNSAGVPYLPADPTTYAKQYQIGSVSGRVTLPFADKADLTASAEYAGSQYNDDSQNSQRVFQDKALLAKGSLDIEGVHLTAKYLDIGPYYYSPGAQTSAYSAGGNQQGYLTSTLFGRDDALPGFLNSFVFQNVTRPSFAPYDRLSENALPYGDSTPDRKGLILGFSGEIGEGGWIKPQASYTANLQETQPNYVLDPTGTMAVPVDGAPDTRTFGGYEGALTLDLAKAFDLSGNAYDLQFDYKHQTTDLGMGGSPFTVNTLIGAADFNIPLSFITPVVWSAAFEQAQASGSEYTISGVGNPPTLAQYPFFPDDSALGSYSYQALNLTRQTLAFGFNYPLSGTINFRGDCFLTRYTWTDSPAFQRYENIWRFTYEAHF